MEKEYTIEWFELKPTRDGTKKAEVLAKGDGEQAAQKYTIWGDFPDFDTLAPGFKIMATVKAARDPKYLPSLVAGHKATPSSSFKEKLVREAQDVKRTDISRAQDNKYLDIKIASTFTASWTIGLALWQESKRTSVGGTPSLEVLIEEWREKLWNMYDKKDTDYPPNV